MSKVSMTTAIFFMATASACTVPDASKEAEAFAKSTGALAGAVSTQFDAEIATEAQRRKSAALANGTLIYSLTPGCSKILADISESGIENSSPDLTNCNVINRLDENRDPTRAELAKKLAGLIAEYATALEALAKSNLPGEIEASSAALLANVGQLLQTAGGDASGVNQVAPVISKGVGSVSQRAKARIIKRAVEQADTPIDNAVSSLIAVLIQQGRDPLYPAIANLQKAEEEMRLALNTPSYGSKVRAFEVARKTYQDAYAKSPTVALDQVRVTHASLVARLQSPATIDEIQSLLDELNELRTLID